MGFKFTIGRKIGMGFGVLLVITGIIFYVTKVTLDSSQEISKRNRRVLSPSVVKLQELKGEIFESKSYITTWGYSLLPDNHPERKLLIALHGEKYPKLKESITLVAQGWEKDEQLEMDTVFHEIDVLFELQREVMTTLSSFESYDDPGNRFLVNILLEDGGDIPVQTNKVISSLNKIIEKHRENAEEGDSIMNERFDVLEFLVTNLGPALFFGGILIAFLTIRTIVNPVQKFKTLILLLGKGIIPNEKMEPRSDEIGDMAVAFNDLVSGFKRTTEFAQEVGAGNFKSDYHPLSEKDELGHSLLGMRKDLKELTGDLEQKVKERTEEVVRQKGELEEQKHEIEELLTEVTDSIHYAKRIQNAILPGDALCKRLIPQSFILFKPKDIVSGDFYWVNEKDNKAIFAAIDCTGHGVPGALMTIVGYNSLNQSLLQAKEANPAEILDGLNQGVINTFTQENGEAEVKDGMDAAMCVVDVEKRTVQYAGAFNPLYIIKNGSDEVEQIKGNKFPIGNFVGEEQKFTNHELQLEKGDTVYVFSDGYADQFGGPKGKKFRYKNFRELLLSIQDKEMEEQRQILDTTIEDWKGNLEQIDDILVIGIRV